MKSDRKISAGTGRTVRPDNRRVGLFCAMNAFKVAFVFVFGEAVPRQGSRAIKIASVERELPDIIANVGVE